MYLLAALVAATYLLAFVRTLSDSGDEGISVLNAARVLDGDIPAHDFVEVIGPGEFYWLALFFRLFGTTFAVAHGELLLIGAAVAVLAFHLAKRAGANPVLGCALVTVVSIPMFPLNSYHWDSDIFALLAFAALVEWQIRARTWLLALAGALAAVTTLVMQQKGVLLCGALLLSLIFLDRCRWKKPIATLLIPYLGILSVCIAFYALHGALHDLIWANFIWPASAYSNVSGCPYGFSLGRNLQTPITALAAALPAYVAAPLGYFLSLPILIIVGLPGLLALAIVSLRRKAFPGRLIPFWICGGALFVSEFQRPDIYHLAFGCPILLLTLLALWRMIPMPRWTSMTLAMAVALFGCMNAIGTLAADKRIETRRGPIYSRSLHEELQFLQAHTRPGDYVFIYPYSPLLNFLSASRNPTRFSYFVYGWQTPEQFKEAVRQIDTKRVTYVVVDTVRTAEQMKPFPHYRAPSVDERIMERYLASRYRQVATENGYRILERVQAPPPAAQP